MKSVAKVFGNHLHKFDEDLAKTVERLRSPRLDSIELPANLHVAYIAWGVDSPGFGEIEAQFSWCGLGAEGSTKIQWPAAVLPFLQAIAASLSRRIRVAELGTADDPIPKLIF